MKFWMQIQRLWKKENVLDSFLGFYDNRFAINKHVWYFVLLWSNTALIIYATLYTISQRKWTKREATSRKNTEFCLNV